MFVYLICMSCIFCDIVSRKINSSIVYEDETILCILDIDPATEGHTLVLPKKHISDLNSLETEDSELIGHVYQIAKQMAAEYDIAESGYRLVSNCGDDGGQTVYHIHFHLLGGRALQWPPG